MKYVTDAIIEGDLTQMTWAVAGMGGVGAIGVLAGWSQFNLNVGLRENVGAYLDARLIELVSSVPGLEHHERSDYLDEIELLRTQRDNLGGASRRS